MANFVSNSGQFSIFKVTDSLGTLNDLTAYLDSFSIGHGNDDVDATSMAAAGAAIAETHYHGALTAQVRAKLIYNPAVAKVLRQIVHSRVGFLLYLYSGSNAIPASGDEIFTGTFTLMDIAMNYSPGQLFALDLTFVPVDGGAVVPDYYVL